MATDSNVSTSATACESLWDRQLEWTRRMDMVRNARTFLYLSVFYIEYDVYGRTLLDALLDAQRRGVRVQLIIDHFGQRLGGVLMDRAQRQSLSEAFAALRSAGAVVTMYRPPRLVQRRLGGGHHVKIQVSDQGDALFSSGNITKSSFDGWNEFAVLVRGPVVPVLLDSCTLIGAQVDAADLAHLRALAPSTCASDIPFEYWFCNPNLAQGMWGVLGWTGPNLLTGKMIAMVDAARESLLITSFYFKPTESLMAAVIRAAERGVHVEVHHSHRDALPATDLAWIAAATSYSRLLDVGVEINENRHGEHSKLVLVDDEWVALGSYNFEDAAHDRLAEAMLATRDARVVEPVRAIFETLRRHPDRVSVTRASLADWPAGVRTRVSRYGRFKRWM